jgi:electron transfer flavoprotein beta subunit
VTQAGRIEPKDGGLEVRREVEGAEEIVHVDLPAVVTAQKGLAEPRFASLKAMMQAKRKKIDERSASGPETRVVAVGMAEPPARPAGRVLGEGAGAVPALIEALSGERGLL